MMVAERFQRVADGAAHAVGTVWAFGAALLLVLAWAALGPVFHWSTTHQLVINTGTTIITFLIVFLIQATVNRDTKAIHLKLDALIVATREARNEVIAAERLPERELERLADEQLPNGAADYVE